MRYREIPFFFDAAGAALFAIASAPDTPAKLGVVIVVGGPQYRVGSHRQFALLARRMAEAGVACLRFDVRGMGDSEGEPPGFASLQPDIAAAIDALVARVPSVDRVVLWGLCDGASACAFYAGRDPRVAGLALYNPWVRTASGEAETVLRHYYGRRLLDRRFWQKLLRGDVALGTSLQDLWNRFAAAAGRHAQASSAATAEDLPQQVAKGISRHAGPILIALSGNDSVAAEFKAHSERAAALRAAVDRANVEIIHFPAVDHTFSCAEWRSLGAEATLTWLRAHFASGTDPAAVRDPSGPVEVK